MQGNPALIADAPIYLMTGNKMAKGQVRSNKETRKPKKEKATAVAAPVAGSAVKSLDTNPFQKKTKK